MAKINLLTIHWGASYGGTMQTYATVKLLESYGHDVKVINLVHPKVRFKSRYSKRSSIWNIVKDVQFSFFQRTKIGHFTKKMYSIKKELIPSADYTIVGSDQVWNSDITKPFQLSYYLDFATDTSKISFCSSFGKTIWEESEDYSEIVKNELSTFKAISVREKTGVDICRSVFGIDAVQLLDPTLLWGEFEVLVKDKKNIDEIFPFLLSKDEQQKKICEIIAQELNVPLFKMTRFQSLYCRSPQEWLRRMKNSKYIITDSFHGLAFSIVFNKQFVVLPTRNPKQFTRLQSLLELLHLEDRYISSVDDLSTRIDLLHKRIDYAKVDKVLNSEREKARIFIQSNIV